VFIQYHHATPWNAHVLGVQKNNMICDWDWSHWTGNYLVWKHPVIAPEQAKELLAEMRSEVNSPRFNSNNRTIVDSRSKVRAL